MNNNSTVNLSGPDAGAGTELQRAGLVLIGAAAGGLLGYAAFFWIAAQGFYGLVLPGGLLGLGAGVFRSKSIVPPVLCGSCALALGLLTEWRFAPFKKDGSFGYFMTHVHQLEPITIIMIVMGTVIGFWVPFSRRRDAIAGGR